LGWRKGTPAPPPEFVELLAASFAPGGFTTLNGLKTALVSLTHEQSMCIVYSVRREPIKLPRVQPTSSANRRTATHAPRTCRHHFDSRIWRLSSQKTPGLLGLGVVERSDPLRCHFSFFLSLCSHTPGSDCGVLGHAVVQMDCSVLCSNWTTTGQTTTVADHYDDAAMRDVSVQFLSIFKLRWYSYNTR
jgi:hypothetical protein